MNRQVLKLKEKLNSLNNYNMNEAENPEELLKNIVKVAQEALKNMGNRGTMMTAFQQASEVINLSKKFEQAVMSWKDRAVKG